MSVGVLLLGFPVLDIQGALYLGDVCYQETIKSCQLLFDEVVIAARRRPVEQPFVGAVRLEDIGVSLAVELPDYGAGSLLGVGNAVRLFMSPNSWLSLSRLFRRASLVYTDALVLEGYLAALVAHRVRCPLVIEMRGDVLFNQNYMVHRFGLKGITYTWLFRQQFRIVRRHAIAGLYINRLLMQSYPIAGELAVVASDVLLPDHAIGQPRQFATVAQHYLYVGHLEKVKRVDLLLDALARAESKLPTKWVFDIIGDGPEMPVLQRLAEQYGIRDHVVFHGRVAWGESLFQFYKQADLLLISSTTESGPRTMFEGMAFGLPVISTRVGWAPDLLDARALVPVGDSEAYTHALLSVVNDPVLMTDLSRQNWRAAQDFRLSKLTAERRAFFARAAELGIQAGRRTD